MRQRQQGTACKMPSVHAALRAERARHASQRWCKRGGPRQPQAVPPSWQAKCAPCGDADGLGAAHELPQPVAGHNQDVLIGADGGVSCRHGRRLCATLRRRPPALLPPARSRVSMPALAAAAPGATAAAALALLRLCAGGSALALLLLLLGVLLGVPAALSAAPVAATAAVPAVCAVAPAGWQHHGHHIRGAGHASRSRHIVTEATADGQPRHVCFAQVHAVGPSRLARLINHRLHDPAAGCLDAGALQRAAGARAGGRVGCVRGAKARGHTRKRAQQPTRSMHVQAARSAQRKPTAQLTAKAHRTWRACGRR